MHSSNRNPFSERSWLSCFGGSSEILSMTYVVLKGYLYDRSDRLRKARGSNGTGEGIQKRQLFSILLVLVSDPGSVSPFFRDELLALVLHFFSVDRGERGAPREEDCTMREARRSTCFKYTTWILAMQCSWTLMSIRTNRPFHGGKSLPARQEDSKLHKFCLGRTSISITTKFINEVVKMVGLPFSFIVVTNLVCVPKKRNFSFFRGLNGVWKHIRTLEWKLKRYVAPVPSETIRSLAQERKKKGLIPIPYHLGLVLLPLFF